MEPERLPQQLDASRGGDRQLILNTAGAADAAPVAILIRTGMIMTLFRLAPARLALAGLWLAVLAVPALSQSDEELARLPQGEGRDTVAGWCGACHSLNLVTQQRLPRWRWEELLVVMREKHGMPALDPADKAAILDYLGEHLKPPPRRRKF